MAPFVLMFGCSQLARLQLDNMVQLEAQKAQQNGDVSHLTQAANIELQLTNGFKLSSSIHCDNGEVVPCDIEIKDHVGKIICHFKDGSSVYFPTEIRLDNVNQRIVTTTQDKNGKRGSSSVTFDQWDQSFAK